MPIGFVSCESDNTVVLLAHERGERCRLVLEGLKNGCKAIGIKQTLKAVESDTARLVFIARDADEKITGNLKELCLSHDVALEYVDTMKQLGKAVGIEVGASAVCLLK